MLPLAAGLLIFRGVYLNSVPASVLPADAAAALFDTFVRFIKEGLRTILVLGLIVAGGAFLVGTSVTAVKPAPPSGRAWAGSGPKARRRACAPGLQARGLTRTGPRCGSQPWHSRP